VAATRTDISGWLDKLYSSESLTHMVVVCDTYDWEDYPIYVAKDEDVREVAVAHSANMQRVMEVYSKSLTKEAQLAEPRAFHYE